MTTYPTILLPGPVQAAYTVMISSSTSTWAGDDISKSVTLQGDGSGLAQVVQHLQDNYSNWHFYLGEEISVDYGKGPIRYYLNEEFGSFSLVSVAGWHA